MSKEEGSELHRLKCMDDYDELRFNRLYRKLKPLIKKLAKNVDARRYNVSPDIIQSYFVDKFLFVFNKYQAEYDDNRLQATLISSLTTFKNRLLRKAYGEQSEYFQSLVSLDQLFDDSKEDNIPDEDLSRDTAKERANQLMAFMRKNLSPDAFLLFEVQIDPPPFIKAQMKTDMSKVSIMMLIDFFGLVRTKSSSNYISSLRKDIDFYIKKAGEELK